MEYAHANTSAPNGNICHLQHIKNELFMLEIPQAYHKLKIKHASKTYSVSDEELCKICRGTIHLRSAQIKHHELNYHIFSPLAKNLVYQIFTKIQKFCYFPDFSEN